MTDSIAIARVLLGAADVVRAECGITPRAT